MRFCVIILPQAEADIERQARWWSDHHSMEQAISWFDLIHEQLGSLSNLPESHSLSQENDDFPYEIRDRLLGAGFRPSYRAVFTVRGERVYVLTVRRGSQGRIHPDDVEWLEENC